MAMDCYAPPPDHTCDIWQAGDSIVPANAIPLGDSRPYFYIKIVATFTTYSESEDGDTDVVESEERVKTFLVPLERLVGSDASWPAISDMLSAVNVPIGVQYNMMHEIDEYLGSVAGDRGNAVAKVVPMIVSISVEDYVEDNSDDDDGGDDYVVLRESMNEPVVAQVPASKAAVAGLETVSASVEGGDLVIKECAICQEEIVVGSTDQMVKRLPCAHVFHGSCVIRWFGMSCFCPLCRFPLPTL